MSRQGIKREDGHTVVCGSTTCLGVVQMVNRSVAEPTNASSTKGGTPCVATGPMDLFTS